MANPLLIENPTIEYYIYLIVIKLAVLIALQCVKAVYGIHSLYKKSMKKKYTARDIEAPHLRASPAPAQRSVNGINTA